MKDLLRIADLAPDDLGHLLYLADDIRGHAHGRLRLLGGDPVVCSFGTPSTTARFAYATAIGRLGGVAEVVGPAELGFGRAESIEDAARVLSRYVRAFVVRAGRDEDVHRLAAAADVPVVNAGTDRHHPCQALAGLLTLRRHFGSLPGLRVGYVGAGTGVAHSLVEACALAGVDVVVASPPGDEPDREVVAAARRLAAGNGSGVTVTHDPMAAAAGSNALYTAAWPAGPDEGTRARRAALAPYRVDARLMGLAAPAAVFLHGLPAHRGEEVTASVIDGPRSLVVEQAENRLHIAQSLLFALVLGQLHGAGGATVDTRFARAV
jgi:ornithine carbamoyltransferase